MFRLAERADGLGSHVLELLMRHADDDRVVGAGLRLVDRSEPVFVLGLGHVHPRVVHVGLDVVLAEFLDDVDDAGVAQVRAVFLEGEAHDQHARAFDGDAALEHGLDELRHHVGAHAVVEAAAGEDDLGVVADGLRLVGEVVGVHADAVAADQARTEGQEVPLAAGGLQHGLGVDAHLVEDDGQLVDEGDVDVALGVLDDLGGFGHLDAFGLVGADDDDLAVELVDQLGHFGGGAGGDLLDGGDAVFLVARVDALGAVAGVEVDVEFEAGKLLQHRDAVFLSGAGVDRGFVDDDVALLEHLADGLAGLDQRGEVGLLVLVDGGGDGDDEGVAGGEVLQVGAVLQAGGFAQFFVGDLEGGVVAGLEGVDAGLVDVEADDGALLGEFDRERQADVTEADDGELEGVEGVHDGVEWK